MSDMKTMIRVGLGVDNDANRKKCPEGYQLVVSTSKQGKDFVNAVKEVDEFDYNDVRNELRSLAKTFAKDDIRFSLTDDARLSREVEEHWRELIQGLHAELCEVLDIKAHRRSVVDEPRWNNTTLVLTFPLMSSGEDAQDALQRNADALEAVRKRKAKREAEAAAAAAAKA